MLEASARDDTVSAGPATELADEVTRIVSAGVEEALARFNDPELLANGKVNIISVEAVRDRFGGRWPARKAPVYEFTDRVLERGVGGQGYYLRLSETDFFVVHPELGRIAGQTACLRYLREVLNHFLGEDQMAGEGVLQVTRIGNGQVIAQDMDPRAQVAADAPEPEPEPEAPAAAPVRRDPRSTVDQWTPFVAVDGREMRVSARLEPVLELKGFTRIGYRMIRRVLVTDRGREQELTPAEVSRLPTQDFLRIDLATVARGLDRLRYEQPSLVVPVSCAILASQRGRAEFVTLLKQTSRHVSLGVVCEIRDIEGVPSSGLQAACAAVKSASLLTIGHLANVSPMAISRLQGSGLQGLAFDCPTGLSDPEFVGWAHTAINSAKRFAKIVMVYGAESPRRIGELASLGATHVSLGG